jgi:uncharacterized protein HemY
MKAKQVLNVVAKWCRVPLLSPMVSLSLLQQVRRAVKAAGIKSCARCAKQAAAAGVDHLRTCSRCQLARYCSEECQVGGARCVAVPACVGATPPTHPPRSTRTGLPEHKRICEEVTEKPARQPNAGQEAVRAGMLELQAAASPSQQAAAYRALGMAYHGLGDFCKAIEVHERALAIAREMGNRAGEGRAHCGLGNNYRALGEYGKAIEFHEQGLAIAREVNDRTCEGAAYGNLGNV